MLAIACLRTSAESGSECRTLQWVEFTTPSIGKPVAWLAATASLASKPPGLSSSTPSKPSVLRMVNLSWVDPSELDHVPLQRFIDVFPYIEIPRGGRAEMQSGGQPRQAAACMK